MAVDLSNQAYQAIYQVVQKILGSREEAAEYAEGPQEYLAAEGVSGHELSGVNMQQVVGDAAADMNLPTQANPGGAGGGAGGGMSAASYPPPSADPGPDQSPAEHLVQHLNYVTHVNYEGDDYITQQLYNQENYDYSTNIDNSSEVNLDGAFFGDVDVDTSSVTATDGGIANAGDGDVVGATGDGALAAGRDMEGAFNTGEFTGAQAGGDIGNSVVGDGNTTLSDVQDSNINFGGEQTVIQDSDLDQSAVGGGNVQTSEVNIEASDGSAVAFGDGDATGSQDQIDAENSLVQTGDGQAQQVLDQSEETNISDETNIDVGIEDSFNEQNLDVEVADSFNDQSTNLDLDLNVADGGDDHGREVMEHGV